jgi:ribonuclease HI
MDSRPPKQIKVVQCNLNRSSKCQKELVRNCQEAGIDFAMIQEPYVGNKGRVTATSGTTVLQHQVAGDVRSAILVFNQNLNPIMQTKYSDSDITVADIKLGGQNFRFSSIYNPPRNDISSILNTLSLASLDVNRMIIGGDVNSNHNTWALTDKTDYNGEKIVSFCIEEGFDVLNNGNTPTFETIRGEELLKSVIDVTFASDAASDAVTDWRVDRKFLLTGDHNAIRFNIIIDGDKEPNQSKSTFKYRSEKADWLKFYKICAKGLTASNVDVRLVESTQTIQDLDTFIGHITSIIQTACMKSMPLRMRRKKICPWWTAELEKLKSDVKRQKNRLSNAICRPDPSAVLALKESKERYAQLIHDTSIESWKKYCGRQGRDDTWSNVYRLLKDTPQQLPPQTLKIGDTLTTDAKTTAEALLNHFYPEDNPSKDTPDQSVVRQHIESYVPDPDVDDDVAFTTDEVIEVFESMNPKKAPGHDHITADIALHFAIANTELITKLYNKCHSLGLFPTQWKSATVIIIPKPGKKDRQDLKSYRPIGLLPVFGKGLESLIKRRLTWDFHHNNLLSRRQFGFTEQTSTSDAIRSAVVSITSAKESGDQVVAVSLDIAAAFDNAWWPALLNGLIKRGVKSNTYRLISHYLVDRKVCTQYADVKSSKQMTKGCVQGSVCGPTFWNVVLDDVFNVELPAGCEIQAFADDVILIGHNTDVETLKLNVEEALSRIVDWGKSVKLNFGSEKTQTIAFTRKARQLNIEMNGQLITITKEIKLLGVIIDEDLKFTRHVIHAIEKAQRIYKSLVKIARPTWGVKSEIIRTIYSQAIEPGLTYACNIWSKALKYKYIRKKLKSFQRPFAVRIARGFKTLSLTSALALADIIPIDLKIKELSAIEDVKLTGTTEHLPTDVQYQGRVDFRNLSHPADRIRVLHVNVETADHAIALESTHGLSIYTDGSKLDGKVGCGFQVVENGVHTVKQKHKLGDECSVFQAELIAIDKGLTYVSGRRTQEVIIFSDSKSSLLALKNRSSVNPIVHNIHDKLAHLTGKGVAWAFVWTRAHVGIPGNEAADVLAKEATVKRSGPIFADFPLTYAKHNIREDVIREWNQRYTQSTTGSVTRAFLPSIYHSRQMRKLSNPTFEMTQILTGHAFNMSYLHRFKIKETNVCPCDSSTEQTISHLLYYCPKYLHSRTRLDRICTSKSVDYRTFTDILRFKNLFTEYQIYVREIIGSLKVLNGL